MAEPKDGESFFRKVVRFVANPATDWAEVAGRQEDGQELERSELKAMVERKRRNDFVRKREFDTLRKLRRDGLSPEQLAVLGGSSRADDSEVRLNDGGSGARADGGVKAKIDEIEQQMVGDNGVQDAPARRPPATVRRPAPTAAQQPADFYSALTEPVALDSHRNRPIVRGAPETMVSLQPSLDHLPPLPLLPLLHDADDLPLQAPVLMAGGMAPLLAPPACVLVSTWTPAGTGPAATRASSTR